MPLHVGGSHQWKDSIGFSIVASAGEPFEAFEPFSWSGRFWAFWTDLDSMYRQYVYVYVHNCTNTLTRRDVTIWYIIQYTVYTVILYSVFWIFGCIWLSLSDSLGQPVCESELYFSQFCCCCEFLPHISLISHGCMPAVSLQWQKVTVLYQWSITARGLCGQLEPLKDEGQTSQPCFFRF